MQYTNTYRSPIGNMTMASDGAHLTGLWFDGQKYFADTLAPEHVEQSLTIFDQTKEWLDCYFDGGLPEVPPPLQPTGSPFRLAVWELLGRIPYGQVTTYGEIAALLARQTKQSVSAQAVGGAVGHNPISILIPCHRVVGRNGSLTGYAGGIDKKLKLLTLEKVDMQHLFIPKKGTAL